MDVYFKTKGFSFNNFPWSCDTEIHDLYKIIFVWFDFVTRHLGNFSFQYSKINNEKKDEVNGHSLK